MLIALLGPYFTQLGVNDLAFGFQNCVLVPSFLELYFLEKYGVHLIKHQNYFSQTLVIYIFVLYKESYYLCKNLNQMIAKKKFLE